MDSYATYDDEIPTKKVSQEIVNEMSQTVDEAKLLKVVDEMSRQRCTSGDEHQYHIEQMQNFLKNDIVWESKDPKAHALSMVDQDLLYLKKGSSGPEKIMMSLHKFPAVIFPDDDIKERTSRWADKCVKKFNPYALYNVEHWKNPHEKIFYIKKQKDLKKPKEIVARRANGRIVSIIESNYKNLNKNDIEDMYLLIVNNKVDEYAETSLLWSLSVFRSTMIWERVHDFLLGIEKYKVFSIVSGPVDGIIYKNNKNIKSLSNEDVEYLQLFKEEIEEQLKHRDQMRRWETYVNKRPLGSRRERPE
ncbi:hypothetical protein Tco_0937301 [Tanacetum coccineum]|uniref:Uncharacterized protein n=1 Tax=Tanacetum coccineum TaxID=301880 RepID=A0ABQ5DDT9_9ASTR